MACSSCGADIPTDERYCSACGYDTHHDDRIEAELMPRLRQARGWILAVGIIYVLSAILQVTVLGRGLSSADATFLLALNGALFVVHLALWWWARGAPLAAAVVALCLFASLQVVNAAVDPSTLWKGLILKALFLVALVQAVRAGMQVHRLRSGAPRRG